MIALENIEKKLNNLQPHLNEQSLEELETLRSEMTLTRSVIAQSEEQLTHTLSDALLELENRKRQKQ